MRTARLPKLPKLQLQMFPGQLPADYTGPENSEIPEPEPEIWPTPEVIHRLHRVQAIIDHGIQNRIREAEGEPMGPIQILNLNFNKA